ncbi:MAG TPA: aminotransferase class III-fold pyridoxal phosphate-dependent enzyme [Thermodesulfobacteriota bacterium]|nr:aminotransferase class III-fold pyridoxal phosphate-dependent enzyme [Thermodesulfobacteriota bacterium]
MNHVFYREWKKTPPLIDRAEGVYLYDREGKRYLDGSGGPAVINIGHGVGEVIDAMMAQARKVCFPYVGHFSSDAQIELSRKVVAFAPPGMARVYFVSGGSEATEIAMKMARQYHLVRGDSSRVKIIGRWQGYHGATIGALSVSGHTSRRNDYQPYLLNFPHIAPAYCYRCPYEKSYPGCGIACALELDKTIKAEGPSHIAAFIAEPFVGNSLGAVPAPPEYFPLVREICDRHGVLFIADEVITGFGRTGKNFGIDHWGVSPDLIITGKGTGSGYTPLAAVIVHRKLCETFESSPKAGFFMGYTYSGNPLSCAAGLAVLTYIEKHGLVQRSARMGEYLFAKLARVAEMPIVGDIRGKGLLAGIEFVQERKSKAPFPQSKKVAEALTDVAFRNGLILMSGTGTADGISGDHTVISPPFTITENQIDELVGLLEKSIKETCAQIGV